MEYGIVKAYSTAELEGPVNAAIKKGWVPQGGVAAVVSKTVLGHATDISIVQYLQAMTKTPRVIDRTGPR